MHRCSLLYVSLCLFCKQRREPARENRVFVHSAASTIFISNTRFNETSICARYRQKRASERGSARRKKGERERTHFIRLTSTYREAAFSALALTFPADATLETFEGEGEGSRASAAPRYSPKRGTQLALKNSIHPFSSFFYRICKRALTRPPARLRVVVELASRRSASYLIIAICNFRRSLGCGEKQQGKKKEAARAETWPLNFSV